MVVHKRPQEHRLSFPTRLGIWTVITKEIRTKLIKVIITEFTFIYICGPGSSVSIANDYGLSGPGSNPSGDEIFCPSRPVLGPTQPPAQCLSWG